MPENALKITRNFRGGVNRLVRVSIGILLAAYSCGYLRRLLDHSAAGFDPSLSGQRAAVFGALGGAVLVLGLYLLKGTMLRMFGILVILLMIVPVLAGHALTKVGAADTCRSVCIALLLAGIVLMYTGESEFSLVPFALRQSRLRLHPAVSAPV